MSSFYQDASLVMIPSGYKTGKVYSAVPTDGTGDLVFTRSNDTATRVASNGLIEKVRTNLLLQSNTFSTTWAFSGTGTVTTGATDPFGGTTAWTLAKTAANTFLFQSTSSFSGSNTFSIFAKAGTVDQLRLQHQQTIAFFAFFDLTGGTVSSSTNCVATIVSVGGGWFRCSISATVATPTNLRIYPASGGSISGTTGSILIYAAQGETGDIATDYIPTTTAAVSVGPVANVPRLDYLNSTCPKLLLEPQRTNIQINSEDFSPANWDKTNTAIIVNQLASPDGLVNADKLNETAVNNLHQLESSRSVSASTVYTMSAFAKKAERSFVRVYDATTDNSAYFNLDSGTIGTISGPTATAKIENYGNGWYRCSVTYTETGTFGRYRITIAKQDNEASYLGVAGSGIYVWGAQYEAGAYATSYIPTLAAAVTRGADAASKTGITSLIGQTQGTLFIEFAIKTVSDARRILCISDGSISNRVVLAIESSNQFRALITNGGVQQFSSLVSATNGINKLAVSYKANDFSFYLNGVQVSTQSSGSVPLCSDVYLGKIETSSSSLFLADGISQALLFKTRLSNNALASLTTL